jgi:hypothetical protein
MEKLSQKEAVFKAVTNTVGQDNDGAYKPTKEERGVVNNILFESFKAGEINYDGELPSDTDLKSYVSGLQSNWLRKDKRLNGGVQYVAKNPGSRAGSTDPQIVAMRRLLSKVETKTDRDQIQAHIDRRLAEVKPTKTVTINIADLPEELKHLAS